MALTDRIRQTAIEVAKRMTRHAENDGNIEAASLAAQRLARFEPEIGGTLHCPTCWIQYGSLAPLVAVPAVSPAATLGFKCEGCDFHL
jgi:hypothetical protein